MTMTAQTTIIINGRDNYTERFLDKLEQAAKGKIVATLEDGAGGMKYWLRPSVRYLAKERKEILKNVQSLVPNARWND